MRRIKKFIVCIVVLLFLIPFGFMDKIGGSIATAEQMFYVRVDITNPNQVQLVEDSGMNIIEKYSAYVYGKATATQFDTLLNNKLMAVRLPNSDPIYIAGEAVYPKNDSSKEILLKDVPEGLGADELYESKLKYYLIKFKAPAKDEWTQELRLMRAEVVEYFHENAYVIRTEIGNEAEISKLSYVTGLTEFLPYFKLPPQFVVRDEYTCVYALIWKGANLDKLRLDIEQYAKGKVISEIICEDFSTFLVWINLMNVADLAKIPDIEYLELLPDKFEGKVDVAKKIIGMNWVDQEYTSGNIPVKLDGSGETVAVFDSGLDTGDVSSLNPDFRGRVTRGINYSSQILSPPTNQPYYGIGYTQRICAPSFDYSSLRLTRNWCDVWGHGTHIAGIIAGTGENSGGQYAGVAPGARLLVQRITPTWNSNDYWYLSPAPQTNDYPPLLYLPAKAHICISKPALWDLGGPDAVSEGVYYYDHIPYREELPTPPPDEIPPLGPYPSFHDVPNVAGEVYGPQFGGYYQPEEGVVPRHPGPPYYAGAAGAFNWAMYDAYNYDARIMNNSWWWYYLRTRQGYSPDPGSEMFSTYDYNMISKFVDNFQYYHQDFLTVWAAGDNGRDRDKSGTTDIAKDLNNDLIYGDPWVYGENQTFFAPAPVKNGITVGACENYRPNLDLFYNKPITGVNGRKANFGLFLDPNANINTQTLKQRVLLAGENLDYFYAPEWEGLIGSDKISDGNAPSDTPDREFPLRLDRANNTDYWKNQTKAINDPTTLEDDDIWDSDTDGKFAMWELSTRGPTSDGRIKPDIVAPGTMIVGPVSSYYGNLKNIRPTNNNYIVNNYPFEFMGPIASDPKVDYDPPYTDTDTPGRDFDYAYMSGTSTSAAFVSGAAAIVRQYYKRIEDLDIPPMPTAALVKATLIHGATNMAEKDFPNQYDVIEGTNIDKRYNDVVSRPDFNQGWGRLNVYKSLFPKAPKVQKFDDNITGVETDVVSYKVFVDNLDVPVEATLVWTDESANPNSWPVLRHNLDLVVIDPAGLVYRGNQFGIAPQQDPNVSVPMATKTDTLNNVERVVIKEPKMKGEYTINVVPSSLPKAPGGPVRYAIVYSGGFTTKPEELPIPSVSKIGLGILGIALLFFGILELKKARKSVV